jgi:hypothetical protein
MTKSEIEDEIRLRNHHVEQVKKLAPKIPRLRHHAFDDAYWTFLAALNHRIPTATSDSTRTLPERFSDALQGCEAHVPRLFRRELVEPRPPTPVKDLMGEVLTLPTNQTERGAMSKAFPEWFNFLVEREKSPVSQLIKFKDQQVRLQQERAFFESYRPEENPWITNDHSKQDEIAKNDPVRAELLEQESHPPAMPNETTFALIAKDNPERAKLLQGAAKVAAEWSQLEEKLSEEEARQIFAGAKKLGLQIIDPSRGQTGDHRRPDQRKPMKLPAFGSEEQERRQHEAARQHALAKIENGMQSE